MRTMLLMMMPTDVPDVGPETYPGADPGTPNLPPDMIPEEPSSIPTEMPDVPGEISPELALMRSAPGEEQLFEDDLTEERLPPPAQRDDVAASLNMDPQTPDDVDGDADELGDDDDDDLDDDEDDTLDDA